MKRNILCEKMLWYYCALMLSTIACNNDKTDEIVSTSNCDCSGNYSITVKDTLARLTRSGNLIIKGTEKATFRELTACNADKLTGLPYVSDSTYNYKVSGGLRPPCTTNGVAYFWTIDISSLSSNK